MSAKDDRPRPRPPGRLRRHLRRNPLRTRARTCHEVFAVCLVLLALALPVAGLLAGRAQAGYEEARQRALRQHQHPVAAVLREDVYTIGTSTAATTEVKAAVSWVAPDGTPHTGQALVPTGGRAGDATTIWLDAAGRPVTPPPSHDRIVMDAVGIGIATTICGAGALAVVYGAEAALFMRSRNAAWAKDWSHTAPLWTSRA